MGLLGIGKPFSEWTRQEKRHAKFAIAGREITVWDYIAELEKQLPAAKDKTNNQPLDHAKQLRIHYMEKGEAGIDEYMTMIKELQAAAVKQLQIENHQAIADELKAKPEKGKVVKMNAEKIAEGVEKIKKPKVKKEKVDGEETKPKARAKKKSIE